MFCLSVTCNFGKAQRWSKSVLPFDRCRLHSVTSLLVYSILIMIHDVRLSSTRSANQVLSEMSQTRLTVLEMQCTRLFNELCSRRFSPMLRLTESFWRESYDTGLPISAPHPTKATAIPIFLSPNASTQITGQPLKKIKKRASLNYT